MSTFDTIDAKVLNEIVLSLVHNPDQVVIERIVDDMGVLLTIKVDITDMGPLIGRNGVMADSIKTVMRAIGRNHNMNLRVKFLEPEGSVRKQSVAAPSKSSHSSKPAPAAAKSKQADDSKTDFDIDGELDEFVIK